MSRAPDFILRDLQRKVADDVSGAVKRSARLLSDPRDMFLLALSGAAVAMGLAVGFSAAVGRDDTPEEAIDLLLSILRPMALVAAGGDSSDFEQLLARAPKESAA